MTKMPGEHLLEQLVAFDVLPEEFLKLKWTQDVWDKLYGTRLYSMLETGKNIEFRNTPEITKLLKDALKLEGYPHQGRIMGLSPLCDRTAGQHFWLKTNDGQIYDPLFFVSCSAEEAYEYGYSFGNIYDWQTWTLIG